LLAIKIVGFMYGKLSVFGACVTKSVGFRIGFQVSLSMSGYVDRHGEGNCNGGEIQVVYSCGYYCKSIDLESLLEEALGQVTYWLYTSTRVGANDPHNRRREVVSVLINTSAVSRRPALYKC
jgi:hypothetical protein